VPAVYILTPEARQKQPPARMAEGAGSLDLTQRRTDFLLTRFTIA
jgi:hypothetical protein